MFKRVDYTKEDLIKAVKSSKSYASVLRELGKAPKGGNYQIIKNKIEDLNLDISHFTGQG